MNQSEEFNQCLREHERSGYSPENSFNKCIDSIHKKSDVEITPLRIKYTTNKNSHMILLTLAMLVILGLFTFLILRNFL